jgi:hypothetical protein
VSIPNTSEKSVDLDRQENLTKGNLSVKKVALYSYDAATDTIIPGAKGEVVTERYDYSDSTTIYVGQAAVGTGDSSTGWTIYKYDLASSSAASGKVATNVSWTNRTTGSYA